MRIANWSQFARTFGDPGNPDAGPFMEGAYLAHSVYGFFQNGGTLCWVIRIGGGDGDGAAPTRAALPAAADGGVETLNAVALEGVEGPVTVELAEEESGQPADEQKPEDKTYRLVVVAGDEREEYDGLSLKKGRTNIAT